MKAKKIKVVLALIIVSIMMVTPITIKADPSVGDRLGDVLNTDIRVFIGGEQIMGYNIDGWTYVIAEDLRAFGLSVAWDGIGRSLSITRGTSTMAPRPVPQNMARVGSVAFPYVHTDIITYINNRQVISYNIQGSTVVRVDDVANAFGQISWDSVERMVLASTDGSVPQRPRVPPRPFLQATPSFERSESRIGAGTVSMLGISYANAFRFTGGHGGVHIAWSHHNLNEQFSILSGVLGRADGSGTLSSTISFIGDGRGLASFTVDGNTAPFEISVNVQGVRVLRIEIAQNSLGAARAQIALVNAMIE